MNTRVYWIILTYDNDDADADAEPARIFPRSNSVHTASSLHLRKTTTTICFDCGGCYDGDDVNGIIDDSNDDGNSY